MIDNNKNINNTGETICIDCSNEDNNYRKNIQNIKHKVLNTLAVKKNCNYWGKNKINTMQINLETKRIDLQKQSIKFNNQLVIMTIPNEEETKL